uniref:Uncharacterized protein n=1 Tax=Clytia hemisphaerica TaxID=252671 RepID=A0A7M5XLJ4_9CNID|eukprot:TCONS_00013452-protein
MENTYFEKVHWVTRIKKIADTSKQRFVLRKKAAKADTSLQNLVILYNTFARVTVSFDDVIKGSFEWIAEFQHQIYPRGFTDIEKRCVLLSYLKKERCEEELNILKSEMRKYLRYYGNKCIDLEKEIDKLEGSEFLGKLILIRDGYLFAQKMLRQGLVLFKDFISDANVEEDEDDEFDENNVPEMILNDNEEEDDDVDENFEEMDKEAVEVIGRELINGSPYHLDVNVIKLPYHLSQGSLNGRNGSSACTTISVLVSYFMPTLLSHWCSTEIVECFVGCMEMGNVFHDTRLETAVDESLALLPAEIKASLSLSELDNTSFCELYNKIKDKSGERIIITGKGKSFCCIPQPDFIVVFDSHLHGNFGATVARVNQQDDFASWTFLNDDIMSIYYLSRT